MAHYVQAILDDTVPGGATAQEPRGEVAESSWIGYHWRVQDRNGHRMINHSGGTSTASTQLIIDKEAGKAVMVYSNTGFTGPSIPELAEHLLYGGAHPTRHPRRLRPLPGFCRRPRGWAGIAARHGHSQRRGALLPSAGMDL